MNSISPNLNLMIKSCEKVSKVLISNLLYKKTFQNKLEFSEITKYILGEYTSYNNNINATISKKGNKLELIFDYMPKQKKYILLPKQYSQTRLVMSAINLNEYSTKNIFKYDLKKGYFEINQYIFFKTKNI